MSDDPTRDQRQAAILSIVGERRVSRQSHIVALLEDRGIHATQSVVSRDLKRLGIAKSPDGYHLPDDDRDAGDTALIGSLLRELRTAGPHLTILLTRIGAAQRLAVLLDRSGWNEIEGTISGDDTIFVATRGPGEQRRLVARLQRSLQR